MNRNRKPESSDNPLLISSISEVPPGAGVSLGIPLGFLAHDTHIPDPRPSQDKRHDNKAAEEKEIGTDTRYKEREDAGYAKKNTKTQSSKTVEIKEESHS